MLPPLPLGRPTTPKLLHMAASRVVSIQGGAATTLLLLLLWGPKAWGRQRQGEGVWRGVRDEHLLRVQVKRRVPCMRLYTVCGGRA